MRNTPSLRATLSLFAAASLAACGSTQKQAAPASTPAQQPASAPAAKAAPEELEVPTGPASAPSTTAIAVRIEGFGPTLAAMSAQLAPLGATIPGEDEARQQIAQQLGMKTGKSLDFAKPAGLIMDASGGMQMMAGMPRIVAYVGTTSAADLRADMPAAPSGHGFQAPAPFAVAEAVPGGLALATDADYLNEVRGYVAAELAKVPAAPGVIVTLDVDHLAEQFSPQIEMAAPTPDAKANIDRMLDWAKQVDTATFTYRPDPSVFKLTVDLAPLTGSRLASVLASSAQAAPPPSGAAIPDDLPIQATLGLSPGAVDGLFSAMNAYTTDPAVLDAIKQLGAVTTGGFEFGASFGKDRFSFIQVTTVSDPAKAKAEMEALAGKLKVFGGILGGVSAANNLTATLKTNVGKVDGLPVDRIDLTMTGEAAEKAPIAKKMTEYLACPKDACVAVAAPTEPEAKLRLITALRGLAGKAGSVPMLERPGVKETAALLGDTSHGLLYVDVLGLLRSLAATKTGATAAPAASGEPGFGATWATPDGTLRFTTAVPVATLVKAKAESEKLKGLEQTQAGGEAQPEQAAPKEPAKPAKKKHAKKK